MVIDKLKNIYVFMFLVTLVSSVVLSTTYTQLITKINQNIEVDRKKNVLKSIGVNLNALNSESIIDLYSNLISEIVLDLDGNTTGLNISDLEVVENKSTGTTTYAHKGEQFLPLFLSESKNATIFPISGKGLWSTMFGYIALKDDLNSVLGITFYKHGETPGLGAEVEKKWFQDNFIDKRIFDENGDFVSIAVAKGKALDQYHSVDGISGATMTSNGVTKLLATDLGRYMNYINSKKEVN